MKTVLVIEDNLRARDMLVQIMKNINISVEIKTASTIDEAYKLSIENSVDLFLVDVILDTKAPGDVSGIQFADRIRCLKKYQYTPIIFTTCLEDPKLYAYSDIHCFQYIEKPYDEKKVAQVIVEALKVPVVKEEPKHVFFRKDGILYKRKISEIIYIENTRIGRVVHSVDGDLHLPYKACRDILRELESNRFIQCSRCAIVNKDYIENIDIVNRYIRLTGGKAQIEIGAVYKKKFLRDVLDD